MINGMNKKMNKIVNVGEVNRRLESALQIILDDLEK